MRIRKLFIIIVTLISSSVVIAGQNESHYLWDKTPLRITLPVGQEKIISFPENVELGFDRIKLDEKTLQVLIVGNNAYMKASQAFQPERFLAKLSNGQLIVMDLNASSKGNSEIASILVKSEQSVEQKNSSNDNVDAITLVRYAAQQLYAPKRLLDNPYNITRTAMHTTHSVKLLPIEITAMPLAQWHKNSLYVTAIELRNNKMFDQKLDPRKLTGNWVSATFYPKNTLLPKGQKGDATTLFLVSSSPFSESIGG